MDCVSTEGHPDPNDAPIYDADTREYIGTLGEMYSSSSEETNAVNEEGRANPAEHYRGNAEEQSGDAVKAQTLPATGGPALLIIAGGLLLVSGAAAVRILSR